MPAQTYQPPPTSTYQPPPPNYTPTSVQNVQLNLSEIEKQQQELDRRAAELDRREQMLNTPLGGGINLIKLLLSYFFLIVDISRKKLSTFAYLVSIAFETMLLSRY